MDVAVKKIELIEWLTRLQDESILDRIDALKNDSLQKVYENRTPKSLKELQIKLDRSEQDIKAGRVFTQAEAEAHFKNRMR